MGETMNIFHAEKVHDAVVKTTMVGKATNTKVRIKKIWIFFAPVIFRIFLHNSVVIPQHVWKLSGLSRNSNFKRQKMSKPKIGVECGKLHFLSLMSSIFNFCTEKQELKFKKVLKMSEVYTLLYNPLNSPLL